MAVLIYNKQPFSRVHYDSWISSEDIYMICDEAVAHTYQGMNYKKIQPIADYDNNSLVDYYAYQLTKKHPITSIISCSESDILRAAKLRDICKLNHGASYKQALNYRDKFTMKKQLSKNAIPTPKFTLIDEGSSLYQFADKIGYPVVLKPRSGSGGVDTVIVRNENQLMSLTDKQLISYREHSATYLVEEFLNADMYHIDGIIEKGKIVFSQCSHYIGSCLGFSEGKALISYTLPPTSPMSKQLITLTQRAIQSLHSPDSFVFHAEIFQEKSSKKLSVCEIACRPGGGLIDLAVKHARNINLLHESIKTQLPNYRFKEPKNHYTPTGFILVPPLHGTLRNIPESLPFSQVIHYQKKYEINNLSSGAKKAADSCADIIVSELNQSDLVNSLQKVHNYFVHSVEWVTSGEAEQA